MTHLEKIDKLKEFKNEKEFREFLIDLLKKADFKSVSHTHRFGSPELGKDIIGKRSHTLEGEEWYAFVVKHGRISGGTTEIETIKDQIAQCFEYPYKSLDGKEIKINRVKIVNNENITNGAQDSITNSPKLKIYNNFDFWKNEKLVELIDQYFPDFWLPGDTFVKAYSKELKRIINEEFEIKDLSFKKIEDKNVRKLIDIFVDPDITEINIEDNTQEQKGKKFKRNKVSIDTIFSSADNFVIVGEAGSGKSRIINNIICDFLDSTDIISKNQLPIKLKAKDIRENGFDLDKTTTEIIKSLTDGLLPDNIGDYSFHLL